MPTLLVTGATGHLGGVLAEQAAAAGWAVVGTCHRRRPRPGVAVRFVDLDVRDGAAVAGLVARERPDAVVHTAYVQDGDAAWAVNVDGSRHVAEAARRGGARLVHLSTDVVFRAAPGRPLREDDPVDPITPYGAAKAAAEAAVAAAHPQALLLRTSLIYGGPEGPASRHEQVVLQAARGERDMAFFRNEIRCPVQVGDLASAILELLAGGQAGPLHVAGTDAVDRHAFARLVAAAGGEDPSRLRAADGPPDRPADLTLDTTRARALLRTPPRGVRDVLR